MASALTSQLNYRSKLSCSVIVVVYLVCAHLVVVIACITCCGAVYNLCLVLLLYMYFRVCIFQIALGRHLWEAKRNPGDQSSPKQSMQFVLVTLCMYIVY